jgi:thiamine transport system substrate-binding protein
MTPRRSRLMRMLSAAALAVTGIACGSDSPAPASQTSELADVELTLVTYNSFPTADTPLNEALAEFSEDTGIRIKIVSAGDTGTMVAKAALTAGNPEGDVMWGVDNTYLSAATRADIFDGVPAKVDFGDVCVNYDIEALQALGIEPPVTLDDLVKPQFADMLVVQNPATSSPGLAFLLASIAQFGEDPDGGWQTYWRQLVDNGVKVVDSWDIAYYEQFSGSAGEGDRPLVVSYGSSPPAEVVFADPPREDAPTGVAADTCFRQEEYAGVLRGTEHPTQAAQLLDFLQSPRFQAELPLTLFVYPVDPAVALPKVFTDFAVVPDQPLTVDPNAIDENRERWQDEWTQTVLR